MNVVDEETEYSGRNHCTVKEYMLLISNKAKSKLNVSALPHE